MANVVSETVVCGRKMKRVKCNRCEGIFVDSGTLKQFVHATCVDCRGGNASRGRSAAPHSGYNWSDIQYHG